jgi:hypothetical protein
MRTAISHFLFQCGVAIAAGAVLFLAVTQVGATDNRDGACATVSEQYARLNWLQSGVRSLAIFARFCDS